MVRAGTGDPAACRLLVDRHLASVVATARRMLGSQADAEDVAQDVFLRVWTDAGRWTPGAARFSTWLYRVTVNRCLDRLRRRPFANIDEVPEPPDPAPDAAERMAARQRSDAVERAMAALPERQRAAIALCHYEGVGNIEAAAILGVSVEALESLLSRGRRALREKLMPRRADLAGEEA